MFDVRRLVVLAEVARLGSLSAAAGSLNYTTSAVSQQISALERDIGAILLVRGPSGARPTAAGAKLLEHGRMILAAIEAAERDLGSVPAAPDVIRVASFATAAAMLLPAAFARFRTAHPDIRPELITADPDDGVNLLGAGDADAALVTEVPGEPGQYRDVHTLAVYDDEFFVVLPMGHRLAGAGAVPLAALSAADWIVSSATGRCPDTRVFQNACRNAGFTPSVTFRPEDYSTVQGLVAADLGVSLVPSLALGSVRTDVAVRRVAGHRPVRRVALATVAEPAAGSPLATLAALIRGAGVQRANDSVCSFPASTFSVA